MRVLVLVDRFPVLTETFVGSEAAALAVDHRVRLESAERGPDDASPLSENVDVRYRCDDTLGRRIVDGIWLIGRHPLRCLADLLARRRWHTEEPVRPLRQLAPVVRRSSRARDTNVHCHFAMGAALDAMRVGRLRGIPFSVTAHAYDIYLKPMNLREKLEAAAVVSTGCDYNVRYLREIVGAPHRDRIHRIVMGVDADRFTRARPLPGGRTVVAVGRLVPKKGFEDLLRAAALLYRSGAVERVAIAGEGEQRRTLEELARDVPVAELLGALRDDGVYQLLEAADLFVMPCVVAPDGDRDSMPVVVKEALSMEVPVVATDAVGLPEVIRHEWGRLVPVHDPPALAQAIAEVLALPLEQRALMGRAGREFVIRHCNVRTETAKLASLLESARVP